MNEQHSPKFETVLRYYRIGVWNKARVRNAVVKDWITVDEYFEIVGEDYE